MAQRDIDTRRSVGIGEIKQESGLDVAVANYAENIIVANQEAKINDALAQAEMRANEIEFDYKLNNAGDPDAGLKDYKTRRDDVYNEFAEGIDPMFRKAFNTNAQKAIRANDLSTQTWGLEQKRKNIVELVNRSIKTNTNVANINGKRFGISDDEDLNAAINYGQSSQNLRDFAVKHVGEDQANTLMQGYDNDYLKSFLVGVAQSNPDKAELFLMRDDIKQRFTKEDLDAFDGIVARTRKVQERDKLVGQNNTASQIIKEVNNPNADYYQTMLRIDEAEVNGQLDWKTAQQVRRVMKSRKAITDETSTPDMADVIDTMTQISTDEKLSVDQYLSKAQSIRADILAKQADGKLRYSDVQSLNAKLDEFTKDRLSMNMQSTAAMPLKKALDKAKTVLPEKYHKDAAVRIFQGAAQGKSSNQVIDEINLERREKVVNTLDNIQKSDMDFIKSIGEDMEGVRATAKELGMTEREVILRLKTKLQAQKET